MAGHRPPNYYAILEVSETASATQIRDAYKRAALKTHPDRVAADSAERAGRTRRFQLVNDAYFTLSDDARRREYDDQRRLYGFGRGSASSPVDPFAEADDAETAAGAGAGGRSGGGNMGGAQEAYSWAWNFFTGQQQQQNANSNSNGAAGGPEQQQQRKKAEDDQFSDVFEEMMHEEGMAEGDGRPTKSFWSIVGGVSGAALGFIVGNVPGALAGVVAGNRLGAVRDARGKSVFAVFQELPQDDKARLLSRLAAKVFSHAVGI